jgi:hypothetical protein
VQVFGRNSGDGDRWGSERGREGGREREIGRGRKEERERRGNKNK